MELAILEARKCEPVLTAYNVGAVLILSDKSIITGYSRELPGNTHAEEVCLIKALSSKHDLQNSTMYTTMEPCNERLSGNIPCAVRIVDSGIKKVYIGITEPDKFIKKCTGSDYLKLNGIEVIYMDEFKDECAALNVHLS